MCLCRQCMFLRGRWWSTSRPGNNSSNNPSNPDPSKNVKWGDRATDEMMDGYLNYVTIHEDLNIQVKNGRVVSRGGEKWTVIAHRADQMAAALARAAASRATETPARAGVMPSPAVVEPSLALKLSPATVEPQSAIARAKDVPATP